MKTAGLILTIACFVMLAGCGTSDAATAPVDTPDPINLPLTIPGRYPVGVKQNIPFTDPARSDRTISITVWYPALHPSDPSGSEPFIDAMPDPAGAPYPLILSSTKMGKDFAQHLVSYGFIYVGVDRQDSKDHWGTWLTDYPLDLVFALNQVASNPPLVLKDMIDSDHAGTLGYSFDGYTSLALSGTRIDPAFYTAQCRDADSMEPKLPTGWLDYICNPTGGWDEIVRNAGSLITSGDDGLWNAITDERIRAVMPMAPEGAWLFGEKGLSFVDRPTLIIGATIDGINIYEIEAVYLFDHIPAAYSTMISFVNQGHMMIYDSVQVARMKHFATAFFGYHLQGKVNYAEYFSESFTNQYDGLSWGPYKK